jgi:hypothetical protein
MMFLAEILDWVEPAAGGWRYLFSPAYRARTHAAWRLESVAHVIWDVFWGALGVAVSLGVAYVFLAIAWDAATK